MKIAIDCLHYPISKRAGSHRASWAKLWRLALERLCNDEGSSEHTIEILYAGDHRKWQSYDLLFFYHGMEFSGSLNLFSGVTPELAERFINFQQLDPNKIRSCDIDFPLFGQMLLKRPQVDGIDYEHLDAMSKDIQTSKLNEHCSHACIVVGDSHSASVVARFDLKNNPNDLLGSVYRNDFKTLYGVLNEGLRKYMPADKPDQAAFYFGNIDVRHHICRLQYPGDATRELLEEYEKQLIGLQADYGMEIELAEVLPMTSDDRRIPKTGYYKGTPFYGALVTRQGVVKHWNQILKEMCDRNGWMLYQHPNAFYASDENERAVLQEHVMEKPGSVHIAPEHYRWNLEEDKPRYNGVRHAD